MKNKGKCVICKKFFNVNDIVLWPIFKGNVSTIIPYDFKKYCIKCNEKHNDGRDPIKWLENDL